MRAADDRLLLELIQQVQGPLRRLGELLADHEQWRARQRT